MYRIRCSSCHPCSKSSVPCCILFILGYNNDRVFPYTKYLRVLHNTELSSKLIHWRHDTVKRDSQWASAITDKCILSWYRCLLPWFVRLFYSTTFSSHDCSVYKLIITCNYQKLKTNATIIWLSVEDESHMTQTTSF